jgi:hypothetical protein
MNSNQFPAFFKDVRTIKMYDPLAQFLGSVKDGIIEYSYEEIVKMAGHSCPTVAGAYLLTCKGLEALYENETPTRGEVELFFKDSQESGVTGVISSVMSNITGACGKGGFKGINGKFLRNNLTNFNQNIQAQVKFTRKNKSVLLTYNPNIVPPKPRLQELMGEVFSNNIDTATKEEFGTLWQERVKEILIDNFDNSELVKIV